MVGASAGAVASRAVKDTRLVRTEPTEDTNTAGPAATTIAEITRIPGRNTRVFEEELLPAANAAAGWTLPLGRVVCNGISAVQ
jgi:hypothetical protein